MVKLTKEEVLTKTRNELKMKDESSIKINGVEMKVCEYFAEAEKHNKKPIDPAYLKEIEEHHEKSVRDKIRLQKQPTSLKYDY